MDTNSQTGGVPQEIVAVDAVPQTPYVAKKVSYGFRTVPVLEKDAEGKDTDKVKQVQKMEVNNKTTPASLVGVVDKNGNPVLVDAKFKRPNYEITDFPQLTVVGLVNAINTEDNGKTLALIMETLQALQYDQGRNQINKAIEENPDVDLSTFKLDLSKLLLEQIALIPREQRGGGIAKEIWESFGKDYTETMVAAGSDPKKVEVTVMLFLKKLQPVKSNKAAVKRAGELLDTWYQATANKEEFQQCYDFMQTKVKELLETDETAMAENLG